MRTLENFFLSVRPENLPATSTQASLQYSPIIGLMGTLMLSFALRASTFKTNLVHMIDGGVSRREDYCGKLLEAHMGDHLRGSLIFGQRPVRGTATHVRYVFGESLFEPHIWTAHIAQHGLKISRHTSEKFPPYCRCIPRYTRSIDISFGLIDSNRRSRPS